LKRTGTKGAVMKFITKMLASFLCGVLMTFGIAMFTMGEFNYGSYVCAIAIYIIAEPIVDIIFYEKK
jgi:hypothetical protein